MTQQDSIPSSPLHKVHLSNATNTLQPPVVVLGLQQLHHQQPQLHHPYHHFRPQPETQTETESSPTEYYPVQSSAFIMEKENDTDRGTIRDNTVQICDSHHHPQHQERHDDIHARVHHSDRIHDKIPGLHHNNHTNPTSRPLRTLLIDNYDSYTYNLYHLLARHNQGIPPYVIPNDYHHTSLPFPIHFFDNVVISPGPGHPAIPRDFGISTQVIKTILDSHNRAKINNMQLHINHPYKADDPNHKDRSDDLLGSYHHIDSHYDQLTHTPDRSTTVCIDSPKVIPILGVCLGHQGLAILADQHATVEHSPDGPKHGIIDDIYIASHSDMAMTPPSSSTTIDLWKDFPKSFKAVRYHSLAVKLKSSPTTQERTTPTSTLFKTLDNVQTHRIIPTAYAYSSKPSTPTSSTTTQDKDKAIIMALQIENAPFYGVQFHPESIATDLGDLLIHNFYHISRSFQAELDILDSFKSNSLLQTNSIQNTLSKEHSLWQEIQNVCSHPYFLNHQSNSSSPPDVQQQQQVEPIRLAQKQAIQWPSSLSLHSKVIPSFQSSSNAVFDHLYGDSEGVFWLDSSSSLQPSSHQDTKAENKFRGARFSYMGNTMGPLSKTITYFEDSEILSITHNSDPYSSFSYHEPGFFDFLESQLQLIRNALDHTFLESNNFPFDFDVGFIGHIGYEMKSQCGASKSTKLKSDQDICRDVPDAALIFTDRLLVFDHFQNDLYLLALTDSTNNSINSANIWFDQVQSSLQQLTENPPPHLTLKSLHLDPNKPLTFYLEKDEATYSRDIALCLDKIHDGESYEICLTNRIKTKYVPENSYTFYRILRSINPAPYSVFFKPSTDYAVCCSSPERFLKISKTGQVESKPIKGTEPRGSTPAEDEQLRNQLKNSVKDRAENLMITDLVRNDLGRVCELGSVNVPHLMNIESFATVHQMVTTVRGQALPGLSSSRIVQAAFPMGSMTGAPKLRTMEIIDDLELSRRGVYSGCIGFMSCTGATDWNVVIRTAVVTRYGTEIGAGGAIVAMSDAQKEFHEMLLKARAIMRALALHASGTESYQLKLA